MARSRLAGREDRPARTAAGPALAAFIALMRAGSLAVSAAVWNAGKSERTEPRISSASRGASEATAGRCGAPSGPAPGGPLQIWRALVDARAVTVEPGTPSSVSLERSVRTCAWVIALLAIAGTAVAVATGGGPPPLLAVGGAGLAWLAWHWGRARRPADPRWPGDVLDALAIGLVFLAAPASEQVLMIPTAGLFLRTLRSRLGAVATRLAAYVVVLFGGTLAGSLLTAPGPATPTAVATTAAAALNTVVVSASGLVLMTVFATLLGAALAQGARAAARDHLLADLGARLLAATTAAEVAGEAVAAARTLVAGTSGVVVHRVPGHGARPGARTAPTTTDLLHRLPLGTHPGDGHLEVRGPVRAAREVSQPLAVLARQVELALQTCAAREELRLQAETDGLTGLATRVVFRAALDRAVAASAAAGEASGEGAAPLATVLIIDCDDFKRVNDTYGHLAGDAVLMDVSRRLRLGTQDGDLLARLGGDEFAVLLQPAGEVEARAGVERLVGVLNGTVEVADHAIRLTCSVGSVEVRPGRGADVLLHGADEAMYAAKQSGGGCHVGLDRPVGEDQRATSVTLA